MNILANIQAGAGRVAGLLGRESWLVRHFRPVYENVLDRISGRRGIPWKINGVEYRIDPRQRMRLGAAYDAPVARYLQEHVKPGDVCFDVGANVGVYVLQFCRWSSPGGMVHAFEPNPAAAAVLKRHIEMNGFEQRTRLITAAVGDQPGHSTLYAWGADGMSRLGVPNSALANRATPTEVPLITIDDYCTKEGAFPDWLFIDIEGLEISALLGARKTIARAGAKLGIIVEMHPSVWSDSRTSRKEAERLLREICRDAVPLTGQKDPLAEHGLVRLAPQVG